MLLIRCNIDVKLRKNKKRKICPAYVSKRNANSEIQVILLWISNREKLHEAKSEGRWHYLAVKKLSTLLRGTTFDDFFW